jgi:hypothetical protein
MRMVAALLAFAPAPKEAGLAGMDFVIVAAALVNLVVFGILLWWMYRAVVALELIAKAQSFIADRTPVLPAQPRKPVNDPPSPTRQLLGCLVLGLAIASSSGCAGDDGDQADGEGEGDGEGGTEPNGDTLERSCYTLLRCDVSSSSACDEERSDDAMELADEALMTCGAAPELPGLEGEAAAVQWDDCIAEQCGCGGHDPATGARVCE